MDCYQTFRKLVVTCRLHKRIVERETNQLGLHGSQHHLLMHLANHETVSQKELASQLKVSPASVAVSLKRNPRDIFLKQWIWKIIGLIRLQSPIKEKILWIKADRW